MAFDDFSKVTEKERAAFLFSLRKVLGLSKVRGALFAGSKSLDLVEGRGVLVVDMQNIDFARYAKNLAELKEILKSD